MIYLLLLILLLWLSFYYDISGRKRNKVLWEGFALVAFVLIAGLRWRLGIDTTRYLDDFYYKVPSIDKFSFDDFTLWESPLYFLICSLVKSMGGRFFIIQIMHSLFVNVLIFKYIKKHSKYLFTCLFFYFVFCYFNYNMEIIRASFSIVICLFANDYIMDKKWLKGYALYIVAFLFHYQTIFAMLMPLLFFLKLDYKGIVILFAALIVGYVASLQLEEYIKFFELIEKTGEKAVQYGESDKYGSRTLYIGNLVLITAPQLFTLFFSILYVKKNKYSADFARLETFAMIGLLFLIMQTFIFILYRIVDIYRIYFVIIYTEVFCSLAQKRNNTRFLSWLMALIVFFPLFLSRFLSFQHNWYRYDPYSSVIERQVDKHRELMYMEEEQTPSANINQY